MRMVELVVMQPSSPSMDALTSWIAAWAHPRADPLFQPFLFRFQFPRPFLRFAKLVFDAGFFLNGTISFKAHLFSFRLSGI
jgi:hypothetical protein